MRFFIFGIDFTFWCYLFGYFGLTDETKSNKKRQKRNEMIISLILFYFNHFNLIRCEAPTRWDISNCPGQVIEAETREKTIVSRSYPTSFGNHWYCKYNIQSRAPRQGLRCIISTRNSWSGVRSRPRIPDKVYG